MGSSGFKAFSRIAETSRVSFLSVCQYSEDVGRLGLRCIRRCPCWLCEMGICASISSCEVTTTIDFRVGEIVVAERISQARGTWLDIKQFVHKASAVMKTPKK